MNIPVCYVIFATLHPIYILNLVSEMLSTLKFKELNFGDEIKPKPRGSPILIYHNDRIYSFGGVYMAGRCFQKKWELNLSSKRWTNCELHTSAVGSGTKPRAPSKETIFNFSLLGQVSLHQ